MSKIESLFSKDQGSKLPKFMVDDMISFLEHGNLLDLKDSIQENSLHGVILVSKKVRKETKDIIESLASYIFDSPTRIKNLGIHIDSPDRPESSKQILTGLYSPTDNYSNIPTICVDTSISDKEGKKYLKEYGFKEKFPDEFNEIKKMILDNFRLSTNNPSEKSLGFWTCMFNICFAHRGLKRSYGDKLIQDRNKYVEYFLEKFRKKTSSIYTKQGEESILIIPNGTSQYGRKISHTRFSTLNIIDRFSHGLISNLSIDYEGKLNPRTTDINLDNKKIKIGKLGVSMNFRSSIDPLKVK